ncbi:Short-chain dehydrogenase/reductase SDR [Planctomycetales bacterium 10988]|nr:Short-chain dehydrogenase/reductase SDR [Planctomycetales bacterium 10988]
MKNSLAGKNAIVTGAGRGIGAKIVLALAAEGVNVVINDIAPQENASEVLTAAESLPGKMHFVQGDVSQQADVERVVQETVNEFGSLDIAVSNAAYSDRELFYVADMDGFEKTVQVTMWGAFYLLRASSKQMIKQGQGGSIVMISSPMSYIPMPGAMAYNMSKAALDQMVRTAATELISHRIRVNLIYPGWIDTPGERKFFSEEKLDRMGNDLPWGRLGKPEEIARGVLFMSDPASDYITGSSLLIDGGITLPVEEMHRLDTPPHPA